MSDPNNIAIHNENPRKKLLVGLGGAVGTADAGNQTGHVAAGAGAGGI